MKSDNFFAELKRRNVYRVAGAYAVVAWLLVQIATQVFPFFEVPNSAVRMVVVVLALGFPIALILAWAFELTPGGIKRSDDVTPEESIASRRGRKLIAFTAVAAVIAAGLFAVQWLTPHSTGSPRHSEAATTSEKSIAVLPFENLSSDKENAYFVAGIQDEILTRLAKIGALKVISRSSTLQYQSRPRNLREIAQQLGVDHILEGSVQRIGDAVHVNVQLINAGTDAHLWAESYDRTLENIFGVEVEIAQTVAETLNAKLSGAEEKVLTEQSTNVPAAYDAYLRGLALRSEVEQEPIRKAVSAFEEAVRLDPQFAAAWAALSRAHSLLYVEEYDVSPERQALAEKALAEATRLQPELAETQLARAYLQYWVRKDYKRALEMMQRLRASWPNNSEVLEGMAYISARLGQWKQALYYMEQAVALNPKELSIRLQAIGIALAMRDFSKAITMVDKATPLWPNDSDLFGLKAAAFQAQGRLDEAESMLSHCFLKTSDLDFGSVVLMYQRVLRHDQVAAAKLIDSTPQALESNDPWFLLHWARVQETAGRKDQAQTSLTRARVTLEALIKEQPQKGDLVGILAMILTALDQRENALKTFDQFTAVRTADARQAAKQNEVRARIFARFGDKDRAIASLEQVLLTPSDGIFGAPVTPALLGLDPMFDPLRGDPRFEDLSHSLTK